MKTRSSTWMRVSWVLAFCAYGCGGTVHDEIADTTGSTRQAIAGGEVSTVEAVVQTSLRFIDDSGVEKNCRCSATVVAPGWLLTARHCYDDCVAAAKRPLPVTDIVATTPSGVSMRVTDRQVAPGDVDVALLLLDTYLYLPATTIPLYDRPLSTLDGQPLTMMGYDGGEGIQRKARSTARVMSTDEYFDYDFDSGMAQAHGDSGGPVFVDIDGVPYLAGVMFATFPGFGRAASTDRWLDWARGQISDFPGHQAGQAANEPNFAVFATSTIRINDGAGVQWEKETLPEGSGCQARSPYPCASIAHGAGDRLGVGARVGGVVSHGTPVLANNASVEGDMVTVGYPDIGAGAHIDGALYWVNKSWPYGVEMGAVSLPLDPAWDADPSRPISLEPGNSDTLTQPGRYGNVTLKQGSSLKLAKPGVYVFNHVTLDGEAALYTEDTSAPTYVYIWGNLILHPRAFLSGTPDTLLVGLPAASTVTLEGHIEGTVVAPKSYVTIESYQHANFYVKSLELHQNKFITASPKPLHPFYWIPETTGWE